MPGLDRKWWTLIAVCTATFMLLLDITVVNVALPDIQRSLHSSFSDLQWVIDAYSLTLAAFLLTAGVIGDMFGRREVFAVGLGVFSASSLVCGLSTTSLMLNLARADHFEGDRWDERDVEGPPTGSTRIGGRGRGMEGVPEVHGDIPGRGLDGHHRQPGCLPRAREP